MHSCLKCYVSSIDNTNPDGSNPSLQLFKWKLLIKLLQVHKAQITQVKDQSMNANARQLTEPSAACTCHTTACSYATPRFITDRVCPGGRIAYPCKLGRVHKLKWYASTTTTKKKKRRDFFINIVLISALYSRVFSLLQYKKLW